MYKNNKKFTLILKIILLILIVSWLVGLSYFLKKFNQFDEDKQQILLENIEDQKTGQVKGKTPEEAKIEEIKKVFDATEIVYNQLPESVTFWTEKACSYLKLENSYRVPDGYYVSAEYCPENEIGTHGGCPTCRMAKIILKSGIDPIIAKLRPIILKYCSTVEYYDSISVNYINTDLDTEKEIFVLCSGRGSYNFAVLDNKDDEWIPIMQKGFTCSNDCHAENPSTTDFDKDGLDEITYSEGGATLDGGSSYGNYLFSFKENKWFDCEEYSYCGPKECYYEPIKCGLKIDLGNFKEDKNVPWIYSIDNESWTRK